MIYEYVTAVPNMVTSCNELNLETKLRRKKKR